MGNGMEIVPLSEAIGAEIRGIDLRQPQDAATVAAINDAWHEHIVLPVSYTHLRAHET